MCSKACSYSHFGNGDLQWPMGNSHLHNGILIMISIRVNPIDLVGKNPGYRDEIGTCLCEENVENVNVENVCVFDRISVFVQSFFWEANGTFSD
jgi:hypothetical protein